MSEKVRKVVVPGEEIGEKGRTSMNVYRVQDKNYSAVVGLLEEREGVKKVVPLNGSYMPRLEDYIVGIVTDVKLGGNIVDLNAPYHTFMPTRNDYDIGDVVSAKIKEINEVKSIVLTSEHRLLGGTIIDISPVKVPRVIGKQSSMLNLIKEKTGCNIFVGRNGRIWLKNGDLIKAEKAIFLIEKEAHIRGLTDKIKEFLEKGD